MLSVPGIYENGNIKLLQKIPHIQRARVIITLLDEEWDEKKSPLPSTVSTTGDWLGGLSGTAQIVGDIISPLEETWDDWEILRS